MIGRLGCQGFQIGTRGRVGRLNRHTSCGNDRIPVGTGGRVYNEVLRLTHHSRDPRLDILSYC